MAKFRKKPVVIEATQWFKNGDHPLDGVGMEAPAHDGGVYIRREGAVVRYFCQPDIEGTRECAHCAKTMHEHGWIEMLEGGYIVCPGDWIITGVEGEHYACKPDIFQKTYEAVEE